MAVRTKMYSYKRKLTGRRPAMGKGVKERFRYFWPRILVFNNLNISNIRRNLPLIGRKANSVGVVVGINVFAFADR